MTSVTIRPVARDDLEAVRGMVAQLCAHHGDGSAVTLAHLRRDLFGSTPWLRMLVADCGGPVGYAALGLRTKLGDGLRGMEVEHLFVEQAHRGRGIGTRLLAATEDLVRRMGGDFITIGTHPGNADARAIYAACGFAPRPDDPNRFRKWLVQAEAV